MHVLCLCTYKTTKCTALYIGTVDAGVVSFTAPPPPTWATFWLKPLHRYTTKNPQCQRSSSLLAILEGVLWSDRSPKIVSLGGGGWGDFELIKSEVKRLPPFPLTWHLVSIWGKIEDFWPHFCPSSQCFASEVVSSAETKNHKKKKHCNIASF